jgi:hypothetical protein
MHDYAVIKLTDLFGSGLPELVRVWCVVAAYGKLRPIDITKATGINKQNVGRAINRLESMGYVKREGVGKGHTWVHPRVHVAKTVRNPVLLPLGVLKGWARR